MRRLFRDPTVDATIKVGEGLTIKLTGVRLGTVEQTLGSALERLQSPSVKDASCVVIER